MQLVAQAQRERREGDALAALDRLVAARPDFASGHADALEYLRFILIAGLASNAVADSRSPTASTAAFATKR